VTRTSATFVDYGFRRDKVGGVPCDVRPNVMGVSHGSWLIRICRVPMRSCDVSIAESKSPPAVTCVVGNDEFLVSRAVQRVLGAARRLDPGLEVVDVAAVEFGDEHVLTLDSPDLFGAARAVVVRGVQDLSDDHRAALGAFASDPLPSLYLVAVQAAGPKAKGFPDELGAKGADVVRCVPITRPAERMQFVQDEIRAVGGQSTAGAVRALVEAIGSDLRELSSAAQQLVADSDGRIDERAVARFHQGRAETTGFAVADAAVLGQTGEALALLRSALETGTAAVLLTSALASGLRDIAKVRSASGGPAEIARTLNMPPWKVEKATRVARGWTDEGLAEAVRAVADADGEVKGGAVDVDHALQRAVLAVIHARNPEKRAARP
jgi:DNA polymerase-3 subunit delta